MNRQQTEAAIATAETEYEATCKAHRDRLLTPVRAEVARLNKEARKKKDKKVRVLRDWMAVLDAGVELPKEPNDV